MRLDFDTGIEAIWQYVIPVNGLSNFNFYYTKDGSGFLSAGNYVVSYWDATRTIAYGNDKVKYSPNSGHTNGVEVRPFNSPPLQPLGINGIVTGRTGTEPGSPIAPIPNALVLFQALLGNTEGQVRTNANGFFSAYYTTENPISFLPVHSYYDYYDIHVSGFLGNCYYSYYERVDWAPANFTDPGLPSYFVTDASVSMEIPVLPCQEL